MPKKQKTASAWSNPIVKLELAVIVIVIIGIVLWGVSSLWTKFTTPVTLTPTCVGSVTCFASPSCPSPFYFNSTLGQCSYRTPQINNTKSGNCGGGQTCSFTAVVLPQCPGGAVYQNTTSCKAAGGQCVYGYIYQNATGICVPSSPCGTGYMYSKNLGKCVIFNACPGGYTFNPYVVDCELNSK